MIDGRLNVGAAVGTIVACLAISIGLTLLCVTSDASAFDNFRSLVHCVPISLSYSMFFVQSPNDSVLYAAIGYHAICFYCRVNLALSLRQSLPRWRLLICAFVNFSTIMLISERKSKCQSNCLLKIVSVKQLVLIIPKTSSWSSPTKSRE